MEIGDAWKRGAMCGEGKWGCEEVERQMERGDAWRGG